MVRIQKISLLFVLLLVTTFANAVEKVQIGDFWYKIIDDENKKVELCDTVVGKSYSGHIVIPSTVPYNEIDYSVTKIGAGVFKNGNYSTFIIPNSISEIGANAFDGCTITRVTYASIVDMQTINYSDRGTSNPMTIAKSVFAGNEELQNKEITISQNVNARTFKGAKWLTGVTIGSGVTSIGDDAFYGTMIESITLPETLESVGKGVFKNCSNLQTVIIEAPLQTLSDQMFLNCNSLTSVTLNEETTATGTSTFYGCSSLTSLPHGLETIGVSAFGKCTGLITLEIPATITSIGNNAFEGCNKIEDIVIVERDQNNPLSIGSEAFKNLSRLKYIYSHANPAPTAQSNSFIGGVAEKSNIKLYYPSGAQGYGATDAPWSSFDRNKFGEPNYTLTYIWGEGDGTVNDIVVGSKIIDQIPVGQRSPSKGEGWTFKGWKDSEGNDITVNSGMPPQNLTIYAYFQKEGVDTQYKYDLLYSPNISTAKIKGFADNYAPTYPTDIALTQEVTIGNVNYRIIAIEANAFKDKTFLRKFNLSGATNLTSIGNGVFKGCTNLESVTFAGNLTSIGNGILEGCTSLVSVNLGSNLTTIPNRAFYGCSKLASFTLPSTIETIGADAFNQCSSLTELPWKETNLQTIKANAFKFCNNLTAIALPSSFQRLEDNAFYGCSNIKMINMKAIDSYVPEVDGTPFSFQDFKDVYLYVDEELKEDYNAEDCYWKQFTINPEKKTLTYILDGKQDSPYWQDTIEPGEKIAPQAAPVIDDRPFSGWEGEPEIMPNENVVVTGSLQYKITYMAEGTSDKLISEPSPYFTGSTITTPVDQLKKTGLTYVIVNPVETMSAKDTTIYVKYSLTTAPTPSSELIFKNTDQELINKVSSHAGTLKYSLDKKTFSEAKPTGKDAKTYKVYYRVDGVTTHYNTALDSLEVTIAPRTVDKLTITLKENEKGYTFNGNQHKPEVVSVSTKIGTVDTTIPKEEYKVSYGNNVNAGTGAKVYIEDNKEKGNYIIKKDSIMFEIKPAKGELKKLLKQKPTGIAPLSYTGKAQNLIKAGTIKEGISGSLKFSLDNKTFDTAIPQGTDAKDYTVYYKVEDDPNYTPSDTASLKVTIKAKEITLSAENITLEKDSYIYDGTAKKPGVTVKIGETIIAAEEYTVSHKDNINVGTATVIITDKDGGNYIVSGSKTFKITPMASSLTKTPTGKTLTYNGTAQELINKDGKTSTGTLEYSLSQDQTSFKETIPTGTDAKTYTVYYRVKGDANHSDSEIGSVKATIAAREVNALSLSQSSYTYTGGEIKPDVTVTWNQITVPGNEYTVSYSNNKNVGTATVIVTDKEGGNFIVSARKTFTITKAPLTITADSYDIFEGDKIPEFTVKYDGFVNKETEAVLTAKPIVSCNVTATSKPGNYTISVGGAKAANYNITHKSGKLTILALKFVSGGESAKDEDDPATYQIISTGNDVGTTPTVAITDDKEVGGAFAIPETVTYHNKNFTVTEINESAFENNKYLTEVSIPSSITSIGDKAFKGCSNLKSITVYITTPISLAVATTRGEETSSDGTSVFDGVDKTTCILYVPEASVDLYKAAPVWCEFKHIVPISTLTGISSVNVTECEPFDVYNLQGGKVKAKAIDLRGLPRGIYIINGKKVAVK